jgi:hypothetical protein
MTTTYAWIPPLCRRIAHEAVQAAQNKENTMNHYDFNQRVHLRRDPSQFGLIGCGGNGDVYDAETRSQLVFWEHEGADIATGEKIDDLMSEEEYHKHNLARYFEHIAENLNILATEFEMDLSTIHTIDFTPHLGDIGWWWMDVDEDMYVLLERGRTGACEVVMEGHYSDNADMYAQPTNV